jgi:hypothetical protein
VFEYVERAELEGNERVADGVVKPREVAREDEVDWAEVERVRSVRAGKIS